MSTAITVPRSSPDKPTKRKTYSKSKSKSKDASASQQKNKEKRKLKGQISSTLASVLHQDHELSSSGEEDTPNDSLAPPGHARLTDVLDGDEFDWDALQNNDDLELVVLRVPDSIKPRHLSHLSLSLPTTTPITSQKVGSLSRKNTAYDLWSIHRPSDSDLDLDALSNEAGVAVGGEELLSMNVLLPRKKKRGRLFIAPKPVTHHLLLTAQPALPTSPPTPDSPNAISNTSATAQVGIQNAYKSPARYQHPKHLLKHRFLPMGAGLRDPLSSTAAPIDIDSDSIEPGVVAKDDVKTKSKTNDDGKRGKDKGKLKVKKDKPKEVGASAMQGSPTKKRKAEGKGKRAKKVKIVTGS